MVEHEPFGAAEFGEGTESGDVRVRTPQVAQEGGIDAQKVDVEVDVNDFMSERGYSS
ncbi:MAG: hypothetical protein WA962_08150 [Ornithinimicrobium sp.]